MKLIETVTYEYNIPEDIEREFKTSTYDQTPDGLADFLITEDYYDFIDTDSINNKFNIIDEENNE